MTYFTTDTEDPIAAMSWLPVFIVVGVYLGVIVAFYLMPKMVDSIMTTISGSDMELEHTDFHDARVAVARGDYEEAIKIYQTISNNGPDNADPWLSQAMLQQKNLANPAAAVQTLKEALESYEWPDDEKAFFMSRMADIQLHDLEEFDLAANQLQQIIDQFPKTLHSANASHQLEGIRKNLI